MSRRPRPNLTDRHETNLTDLQGGTGAFSATEHADKALGIHGAVVVTE